MADFTKGIIYGCILLSAAGGGTHVWLTKRYAESGKETDRALRMLQSIAVARQDISSLETEVKNDAWIGMTSGGQSRYQEYFAQCASKAKISIDPIMEKPKDTTPRTAEGAYKDTAYEMSWKLNKRDPNANGFTREQVAAFLWNLEDSKLLRVTYLQLTADDNFTDHWIPRVHVTERRPKSLNQPTEPTPEAAAPAPDK